MVPMTAARPSSAAASTAASADPVATDRLPTVRILPSAAAAVPLLLGQVRLLLAGPQRPVLGFATGATFTAFLQALAEELRHERLFAAALVATHLDEYLGFGPTQPGGMVHELESTCPPLARLRALGAFVPVPSDGTPASLQAHERRLQQLGGVQLQLLGIGRNGHLAFNEPGTPFDRACHVTTLAATTRQDARPRFLPNEPPLQAVTSGLATIAAARRLVLCAFGKGKAAAVRAMLFGPIDPQCPASLLRHHADAHVLLDRDAASELPPERIAAWSVG